jgi:cytidylate kinase
VSRRRIAVAIDGPAGAGKSTVSRAVADRIGYVLLDTGALYRCVALAASRRGVDSEDADRLGEVARDLAARHSIHFSRGADGVSAVLLDGEDVTRAIRTQEVSDGASKVSAVPAVRAALLAIQRDAAAEGGVVLEGRDIGTVVLPDAEAKFFLTASVAVRADRRYRELLQRGEAADLDTVRREVEQRDLRDSSRPVAPLTRAADAVLVDSSDLSLDQVIDRIVDRVHAVVASGR